MKKDFDEDKILNFFSQRTQPKKPLNKKRTREQLDKSKITGDSLQNDESQDLSSDFKKVIFFHQITKLLKFYRNQ